MLARLPRRRVRRHPDARATATRSRPKNACRVCVVEVEGSRTLVPSCSRKVEAGMVVHTDTERVRHSRKMVLELLGSSVDLSVAPHVADWNEQLRPPTSTRFGAGSSRRPWRSRSRSTTSCTCATTRSASSATSASTPAASSGRTRSRSPSPAAASTRTSPPSTTPSCPTVRVRVLRQLHRRVPHRRADVHQRARHARRRHAGTKSRQTETDTICPYCGVGCTADAPRAGQRDRQGHSARSDHSVTHGNLCIKGRFGFQHVQNH